MRRVPIRLKLAAALAVPMLVLLVVTFLEVGATAAEADEVAGQARLAKASTGPAGLITKLQDERTYAVVELIGTEASITVPNPDYESSRAETDKAIAAFRHEIADKGSDVAEVYREPLANLEGLREVREKIDAHEGPRDITNVAFSDEVYSGYAGMIRPFFEANTRLSGAIDDPELRQGTALVDITSRQIEVLADLARRTIVDLTIGGGIDEPDERVPAAKLMSTFLRNNEEILAAAPPYDRLVAETFPEELVEGFTAKANEAILEGDTPLEPYLAALDVPEEEGYLGFRNGLADAVNERADELNESAENREKWYLALAVVTLVGAFALTWAVSRSITVPLRSLTRQAKQMADERLPDAVVGILGTPLGEDVAVPLVDPVSVRTRDEVADVAEALNTVQDTALDLAVEQAVLRRNIADSFVNLGRRNQNLLGRQLDFITELESNETDADTLGNLFRLDHLATRMRRNAESLLVLAGVDPPRRWAAPVRLGDVIRAALGEVEDYQRVAVRAVEPATVLGAAASDLAHLLAELIENALVFSPPDRTVDIRGRSRPDGYSLAIIDSGGGMTPDDLAAANRRLAGVESFTVAPSKYLGHYVAGNLAARLGARVHLSSAPDHGITAVIDLPGALLSPEGGLDRGAPAGQAAHPGEVAAATPGRPAPFVPPAGAPAAPGGPPGYAATEPAAAGAGRSPLLGDGWLPIDTGPAGTPAPPPASPAPPAPPAPSFPVAPAPAPPRTAQRGPVRRREPVGGDRTRGGLAKRGPAAPGGPAVPAAPPDADLIRELSRYTPAASALPPTRWGPAATREPRRRDRTGEVPAAGDRPPPASAPRRAPAPLRIQAQSPPGASPGVQPLPRRVRGAQVPRTQVVRRSSPEQPGRADTSGAARPAPVPDPAPTRAADDVYSFLSNFTSGVQRGLDEAGGGDREHPDHPDRPRGPRRR